MRFGSRERVDGGTLRLTGQGDVGALGASDGSGYQSDVVRDQLEQRGGSSPSPRLGRRLAVAKLEASS